MEASRVVALPSRGIASLIPGLRGLHGGASRLQKPSRAYGTTRESATMSEPEKTEPAAASPEPATPMPGAAATPEAPPPAAPGRPPAPARQERGKQDKKPRGAGGMPGR